MNAIDWVNQQYHKNKNLPSFKAGDSVKVHVKIKEGDKERIQIYEGVVIRIHRQGPGSTFTVRKVSYGVGVERIFPYSSPTVEKIELISSGKVRRAKLYYLRDLSGKKARIQSLEQFNLLKVAPQEEIVPEITEAAEASLVAEQVAVTAKEEAAPKKKKEEKAAKTEKPAKKKS